MAATNPKVSIGKIKKGMEKEYLAPRTQRNKIVTFPAEANIALRFADNGTSFNESGF